MSGYSPGGLLGNIAGPISKLDPVTGAAWNALGKAGLDPLGLVTNNGPSTSMTPQEQLALSAAQPFLAEYNSGKLNPANEAVVNQADTNATEAALQSFANAGMISSSSRLQTTGKVTPGNSTMGLQAGAGSNIDISKASNTQQILQTDLNNALAYLGVAAGDAAALTSINLQQNADIVSALGAASQAFGKIYGSTPGSTSGLTSTFSSAGQLTYDPTQLQIDQAANQAVPVPQF